MGFKKGQAPWETGRFGSAFVEPSYKKGHAPWETQEENGHVPKERIDYSKSALEEMHPAISAKDRAIVKNFANNPAAGVAYLQKQYPHLNIGHDNERYIISAPGDEYNRVLDPDTGVFSRDLPQDLSDIAYDVGAGVAETGAAIAGTSGGLLAAGPGGALVGGTLGAGAAGAGTEYARQKIGQKLGVPQDVDPVDVAVSGTVSGLTAGAMGTNPLKSAINRYTKQQLTKGLSKEAIEDLITKSSQGALKRSYLAGTRKVAPWLASKASGVDKNLISALPRRMSELDDLEKKGVKTFLNKSRKNFSSKFNQAKSAAGEKIDDFLSGVQGEVDISKAKQVLQGHIAELEKNVASGNAADIEKLDAAKNLWNTYFARPVKEAGEDGTEAIVHRELSDQVDAPLANRIKGDLTAYADTHKSVPGGIASRHSSGTPVDQKILMNKADASRKAIVESLENAVDDPGYEAAKKQYGYLKDQEKNLGNMFKSDKRYYSGLKNLSSPANTVDREALEALDKILGTKSLKDAEMVQLYSTFAKPSSSALSIGGTTSTSRTIPLSIAGGTLGSLAGYQSGGGYSGAAVGGAGGATIGASLASPAAMKFAIKQGLKAERLGSKVKPKTNIPQAAVQSVWQTLLNQEKD